MKGIKTGIGIGIFLAATSLDCHPLPASTPPDIGKVVSCLGDQLQKGVTDPLQAATACLPSDIPLAEDLFKSLTGAEKYGESVGAAKAIAGAHK